MVTATSPGWFPKPSPDPGVPPTTGAVISAFTPEELDYLTGERRLARIATVGRDGTPHVVPSGFSYNAELGTIDLGGHSVERTKKFRDVARSGRAAVVIDDLASTDPFRPRGVEIRGRAEAVDGPSALIRIHPERIVAWGIDTSAFGERNARDVSPSSPEADDQGWPRFARSALP